MLWLLKKNRLIEMFSFEHPQHMFTSNQIDKKIITLLPSKSLINLDMCYYSTYRLGLEYDAMLSNGGKGSKLSTVLATSCKNGKKKYITLES